MATFKAEARDPQGTHSYNYHSSGNYAPSGTLEVINVTPSDRRIKGDTTNAQAQRDSIARQYTTTNRAVAAA